MKIVGIIVEYNPLHNGHAYHVNKIKELASPDLIIAVMSGSITMRGDLSIHDKFNKAIEALNNSVDIVIELPMVYSVERADIFCKNAVDLLSYMMVDEIWIGSEENNTLLYEKYYNDPISTTPINGQSYKKSSFEQMPFSSNDILGYGYYKAIRDNNYNIKLNTIKREASNYLDKAPTHTSITSALAIRGNLELIKDYCPSYVSTKALAEEKLFPYLKYKILTTTPSELKEIFFVDEGMENKLIEIKSFNSLNEFIKHLTSKRYTSTRIKRMLVYILFNIKKIDINELLMDKIPYVRVLGYSKNGKDYINKIKKDVLIYTNIKEGLHKSLDIELRISRLLDYIYDLDLFTLEQRGPQTIE